jgi:hypothetical protein
VQTFEEGRTVIRREVLHGQAWLEQPVSVVADDGVMLAVLLSPGSPMTYPPHPTPHPWRANSQWQSTHVLQLYRADDWYSVWHFFEAGRPRGWYVNFEMPVVRHSDSFDTGDYGLDIVLDDDGSWSWKDVDDLDAMLASGRVTQEEADGVRRAAERVAADLDAGRHWWPDWSGWTP